MYNVLSFAHVHLLVLILYLISQYMVMVMNLLNKTLNYESRLVMGKMLRNLILL